MVKKQTQTVKLAFQRKKIENKMDNKSKSMASGFHGFEFKQIEAVILSHIF